MHRRPRSLLQIQPKSNYLYLLPPKANALPLRDARTPMKHKVSAVTIDEAVLGFDARPPPSQLQSAWPLDRRKDALLRPDVVAPLSTDYLVWPSPIQPNEPTSTSRGPVQSLWDRVERLEAELVARPVTGKCWIVAVALVWQSVSSKEDADWRDRSAPVKAPRDWLQWRHLGYDVADQFLTTGMVWFRAGEAIDRIRARWASRINQHHLFSRCEDALAFRQYSDSRSPEHAPHFVYRLALARATRAP